MVDHIPSDSSTDVRQPRSNGFWFRYSKSPEKKRAETTIEKTFILNFEFIPNSQAGCQVWNE